MTILAKANNIINTSNELFEIVSTLEELPFNEKYEKGDITLRYNTFVNDTLGVKQGLRDKLQVLKEQINIFEKLL